MPGAGLCALLLCLLPGLAQEVDNSTDTDPVFWSQAVVTVSSLVTSSDLRDVTSGGSESASVAPSEGKNETITLTDPPTAEAPPAVSGGSTTGAPPITEGSQEPTTDSRGASPNPETRGTTGSNFTQTPPTTHAPTRSVTEEESTEPVSSSSESPLHPRTTEPPEEATPTSAITTSLLTTTTVTTVLPTHARPHTTRAQEQRELPVLEESHMKELPSFHSGNSSNPLFVMIVSVFTIVVVMVVVVVGFRRYKKRNRRTEFRRLQDLPMDDMMEDTPLSLYSY